MFDLNLIPLNYTEGQELGGLPGLYAAATPRRAARGRNGDLLAMLISFQNGTPLAAPEFQKLFEQMAQTYYQIPGTVTAALRSVVEVLSQALLDRNLANASSGRQGLTLLNLAAIHGSQVYLAHCGPTHTFLVSARATEHFTDPQLAGRGLGLSRAVSIRYYQANLEAGSSLVFCPEPPPAWNTALLSSSALLPAEILRRRLVGSSRPNLSAAVIQIQDGSGKIALNGKAVQDDANRAAAPTAPTLLRGQTTPPENKPTETRSPETPPKAPVRPTPAPAPVTERATPAPAPVSAGAAPAPQPVAEKLAQASTRQPNLAPSSPLPASAAVISAVSAPASSLPGVSRPASSQRPSTQPERPSAVQDEPVIQEMKRRQNRSIPWSRLAPYWNGLRSARQRAGKFFQGAAARLLPAGSEPSAALSPALLTFIALAVPLVIAAIGLVVYLDKGVTQQYQYNLGQAQLVAKDAAAQTDPQIVRNDWESTLIWLDTAEKYRSTNESAALRQQAQNALDQLDAVVRLTFQPALVSALPQDVSITRMVTVGNDLYLLDSTQGSVIRAILTGQGYQVDSKFQCGPGPSGSLIISPLIDMLPLSLNNHFNAAVVAIDKAGNILYCLASDEAPVAMDTSLAPPGDNWGKIIAMALDNNQLYVLDPRTNIGVFAASGDDIFSSKPDLFFSEVPAMGDVVDMAVNSQDLYLLHSDGHMTLCTFSSIGVEPTRCTDPAPYADPRPGNEANPVRFLETHFSRIEYSDPPDPSIYLLDPNTATIYHFSLRLNLQRLLRPQALSGYLLPSGTATAFYISQNRMVFMAFGSQVLLASLP